MGDDDDARGRGLTLGVRRWVKTTGTSRRMRIRRGARAAAKGGERRDDEGED